MPKSDNQTSSQPGNLKVLARARTRYNDIFVIEDGVKREMWFNGNGKFFLQTRIDIRNPRLPALVYSKMILATLLIHPNPRRILVVGLGGGALSNSLATWYPECQVDVVEIDPKVIALARKYFMVEEGLNYRVVNQDGRLFIRQQGERGERYDIVYLDAFKSGSIPYHLKTFEFYRELKAALKPEGVVASNLYGKSNTMKPHDRETFLKVFPNIYLFEDEKSVATISIATQGGRVWSREEFITRAGAFVPPPGMEVSMGEVVKTLKTDPIAKEGKVLRDDFAPGEFDEAIDRNNSQRTLVRQYPIKNVS